MPGRLERIAERARVSPATVSRVLNDKPGVAASTRRAVVGALDVLGYERPEWLRSRATGIVGVIVPELGNPIFPRLVQEIESGLALHRFTPLVCSQTAGGVLEDDYVRTLATHGASGIVFVSGIHAVEGTDPTRYQALVEQGLPFVLVNGSLPEVAAPSLSVDDEAGVVAAVEHLHGLGHTRIGLAPGEDRYQPVRRRLAGHAGAVRRLGEEPLVELSAFTVEGGAAATTALVARGATAVVCGSDLIAIGAIRAVRDLGLRVPEDVSVVGSDDSLVMPYLDPPLTTLRQPAEAIGAAAAASLVELMTGATSVASTRRFAPELVVRASTGRAPVTLPA